MIFPLEDTLWNLHITSAYTTLTKLNPNSLTYLPKEPEIYKLYSCYNVSNKKLGAIPKEEGRIHR